MQTSPVTTEQLHSSVIAVPPLARNERGEFCGQANARLIRHIEDGGVSTLLYGGNANFYHLSLREYGTVLQGLVEAAGPETLVIPSVGPAYGFMTDQLEILRDFSFPTVMVLPQQGITTSTGVANGIRRFVHSWGKPVVLYMKNEGYIEPSDAAALVNDGLISWIKYAVVRENPAHDPLLSQLLEHVDASLVISGIGEQPAIEHWREFGIRGYTSGCVCIRPDLSQQMLEAMKAGDFSQAEEIRQTFRPLEDLRNAINPIRVLHDAVKCSGIADTGPQIPFLTNLNPKELAQVAEATRLLGNA